MINFARFLNEEGVPWNAIHHEVSLSRWMFDAPHPAATVMTDHAQRRRVDLVLIKEEDFLSTALPAVEPGFRFDAFLEFGYLSDYFTVSGARNWGEPIKGRTKVESDIAKLDRHLAAGACRVAYAIIFEECSYEFADDFVASAEAAHGCRVRFIRGYEPT